MKKFWNKLMMRIMTFLSQILISVLFALEILIDAIILNLIYLVSGKQIEFCQITRAVVEVINRSEYIE